MYFLDGNVFLISEPIDDEPATHGNGSTVGFAIKSPEQGDEWHEAGINSGGTTCEDPPGIREGMGMKLYLAYLETLQAISCVRFLIFRFYGIRGRSGQA